MTHLKVHNPMDVMSTIAGAFLKDSEETQRRTHQT